MGERAPIRLEPWGEDDLSLVERLMGDPAMTEHLGGPESPEKLVGFWEREWRGQKVYEIGWSVLPEFQGRGIAGHATEDAIELAREEGKHRFMHAFPSVDNAPSNAICRKLGFTFLEACDFEFPPGNPLRCNDWRLDLRAAAEL